MISRVPVSDLIKHKISFLLKFYVNLDHLAMYSLSPLLIPSTNIASRITFVKDFKVTNCFHHSALPVGG